MFLLTEVFETFDVNANKMISAKTEMFYIQKHYLKLYSTFHDIVSVGEIRWLEGLNVERTETVLNKISAMLYGWIDDGDVKKETIYGIEVLNEPWGK